MFSHLAMEIVGGRDGDVFTLKERKNELASFFVIYFRYHHLACKSSFWLLGNVAFLSKVMLFWRFKSGGRRHIVKNVS